MTNIGAMVTVASVLVYASLSSYAAVVTVSKTGTAQYRSIQAAVNAAHPGDEVVILDTAVYEEMVTIDSAKSGLVLRSQNPSAVAKPAIRYQDKIHVGPRTDKEALIDSMIDFDRNGALRILGAVNIRIGGIIVDGGGVYPFGADNIWSSQYALQHGNAAITVWMSGDVIISDCEMRNAYIGVNVKDRNERGIYATPNFCDCGDTSQMPLFAGFGRTGNHLIEYNRIHDNSVGIFFESTWDLGSTIRYNRIYENHHATAEIAAKVKALTSEGGNQCGGALMFKDHLLSPVAIYNNTFWHNSLTFIGNWKSGGQHLIFNNIYGTPNEYLSTSTTTFATSFEMSKCFTNRMHNCVYAAQLQKMTTGDTLITFDLKVAANATGGAAVTPFPANADVRWVETPFLSTDPSSPVFLVPDWNDTLVNSYIINKGWEAAGVKDPDGTRADIGAVSKNGGRPMDVVTIRPAFPVRLGAAAAGATAGFIVTPRVGTISNVKLTMLGLVRKLDTSDVFGRDFKAISMTNIITMPIQQPAIVPWMNAVEMSVPAGGTGDFAFFELFAEGTGSDGRPFTSAAGFIPYRKIDYPIEVTVLDKSGGSPVSAVRVGQPVVLRIKVTGLDSVASKNFYISKVFLSSRGVLHAEDGAVVDTVKGGITGITEMAAVFSTVPPGGVENVLISARQYYSGKVASAFGSSDGITILPDLASTQPAMPVFSQPGRYRCELIDLRGRVVKRVDRIDGDIASDAGMQLFRSTGRGVYLVRMVDLISGRVTQVRQLNLGR